MAEPQGCSNPGLKLANAFGVSKTVLGVSKTVLGVSKTVLGVSKTVLGVSKTVLGVSKTVLGKINDILGAATNPGMMRYGYPISPLACCLAALLLWLGSRSMNADNSDTTKT